MSGSGNHSKKRNVPKGVAGMSSNAGGGGGLESVNEMSEQLESIQQVSSKGTLAETAIMPSWVERSTQV